MNARTKPLICRTDSGWQFWREFTAGGGSAWHAHLNRLPSFIFLRMKQRHMGSMGIMGGMGIMGDETVDDLRKT